MTFSFSVLTRNYSFLCVHVAIVSVIDWRYYKKNRVVRGHGVASSSYAFEPSYK